MVTTIRHGKLIMNNKLVFLSFFLMMALFSPKAYAQCIPDFLGNDRTFVLCSPTATIDYVNLFQVQATYSTKLLTPTDIIKTPGEPDVIIFFQVKYEVTATLPNGCQDIAIIRVPINRDPYPDLGRDTIFTICRGDRVDLLPVYDTKTFEYTWSTQTPESADAGVYKLIIKTRDLCTDTAFISVKNFPYISLGDDKTVIRTPLEKVDLFLLADTAGLAITWNTPTPAAAGLGNYWAIGTDKNGCRDTIVIDVCVKPDMGKDTTIKVCLGLTRNLYTVYPLTGLLSSFDTFTPSAVTAGVYKLFVTNICGGKDTVTITVVNGVKPNLGLDRTGSELGLTTCENVPLNIADYYILPDVVYDWSQTNPEAAPPGLHRLIVTNKDGCKDTAFIEIIAVPRKPYYIDTTVYICGGQTKNLTKVYPSNPDATTDWINILDPTKAPVGLYNYTVSEAGCEYNLRVTVASEATRNAQISLCTYTAAGTLVFTTNSFRSVVVDKQGFIWAGADGNGTTGGLYRFERKGIECNDGTWKAVIGPDASSTFPKSSYRDLHLSNITNDNAIWSASNGNNAVQAIDGGVYKVNSLASVTRFGSVMDNDGTLSSRLVNSLAVAPNGKLYAGLGVSQSNTGVVGEGDVYEYDLAASPAGFIKTPGLNFNISNRQINSLGMRGTELWVGVQQSCLNGVCLTPYIQRWNTVTNTYAGNVIEANSPIPFETNPATIVRAIFTSSLNKTFVGLNLGQGFAVYEKPENGPAVWTLLNSDNSAFPANATVNFNAISEVNGEIWIGTTQGILVYDGVGKLTTCSSYTLYNTTNGLDNNNVTDIAYDKEHQEVWITHSGGVSKVRKAFTISGTVLDVFCGSYTKVLVSKIASRPIQNAVVKLIKTDGSIAEQLITGADGKFNLKNSLVGQTYKVRVEYKSFILEYNGVAANSFLGNVLIPDSLIKDITAIKDLIKQKEVEFKLPENQILSLVWEMPPIILDGYPTTNFEKTFEAYTGIVADKHKERIDNLAIYYLSLATINDIGENAFGLIDQAIELGQETIVGVTEFAASMKDLKKFQRLWKDLAKSSETTPTLVKNAITEVNKIVAEGKTELLAKLREQLSDMLNESVREGLSKEGQEIYDKIKEQIDKVLDGLIESQSEEEKEEGAVEEATEEEENSTIASIKETLKTVAIDALKKLLSGLYYKYYTRIKHENLIPQLSVSTNNVISDKLYTPVFAGIYDAFLLEGANNPSIRKQAIDMTERANQQIVTEKALAASASEWSDITNTASKLALSTVALAELAPFLKTFSVFLGGLDLGLKGVAFGTALVRGVQVGNLSDGVVGKTGFPAISSKNKVLNEVCTPLSATQIQLAHKAYVKALNDLKTCLGSNFDTVAYANRYRILLTADSAFTKASRVSMEIVWAHNKNAVSLVPGYSAAISRLITRVLPLEKGQRTAFTMQSIGYVLGTNKADDANRMLVLIDSIKENSFASVSLLTSIIKSLNEYCVPAGVYLVKSGYSDSTSHQPGTAAKFTCTFTNYGNVALNEVAFKLNSLVGGFSIVGGDSIHVPSIGPGQSVPITFRYLNAAKDTIGGYELKISSPGVKLTGVSGALFTRKVTDNSAPVSVKSGLWSNPSTWSTGKVPSSISAVTVKHEVTVDIDGICKSLKAILPGLLHINAGKRLDLIGH